MIYQVAARSMVGKVRKNNEDNFCVNDFCLPENHSDSEIITYNLKSSKPHLIGVFDGMGGYSDGEKASYIAASTAIHHRNGSSVEDGFTHTLINMCMDANDLICAEADGSHMGTTCAAIILYNMHYTLCNIGDSPIFLVRDGAIRQLSIDHNQKATFERATGKPARPGQKFKLTQCLGIPKEDMLIEPYTEEGMIKPGDVFLLCSDGVTDMVSNQAAQNMVLSSSTAEEMVARITEQAYESGGRDNITLICIQVLDETDGVLKRHCGNLLNRFRAAFSKLNGENNG